MIELQPELVQTIQQIGAGIFAFLIVTAVVKLIRGLFRSTTDGYSVWQNRRAIYLLEKISADTNAIGLQLLKLREEFSDEDRLQEHSRQ